MRWRLREDPLRAEAQDHDQRHADQKLTQCRTLNRRESWDQRRDETRGFKKRDDHDSAANRTPGIPDPADKQRKLDVEREQRNEDVGCDKGCVVTIEGARQPKRRTPEGEGLYLEYKHMLAGD